MKLTDVIEIWDELKSMKNGNTGDIGYSDLEKAIGKVIGIENDASQSQPEQTQDILTVDKLKAMSPRIIFATGVVDDPRLYRAAIRWVAVRGKGMPDWAIYYHDPTQSVEQIRDHGDKCFTEAVIKDLVPCDRDAFKMYRY